MDSEKLILDFLDNFSKFLENLILIFELLKKLNVKNNLMFEIFLKSIHPHLLTTAIICFYGLHNGIQYHQNSRLSHVIMAG